jgi:hypothetical protein
MMKYIFDLKVPEIRHIDMDTACPDTYDTCEGCRIHARHMVREELGRLARLASYITGHIDKGLPVIPDIEKTDGMRVDPDIHFPVRICMEGVYDVYAHIKGTEDYITGMDGNYHITHIADHDMPDAAGWAKAAEIMGLRYMLLSGYMKRVLN